MSKGITMKRFGRAGALLILLIALGDQSLAQQNGTPAKTAAATAESLSAWEFYADVQLPKWDQPPRWLDFVLTPGVLDKARPDLADLRLYDGKGKEVPYALRIRQSRDERQPLSAREFNRGTGPNRSAEVQLELTAPDTEHNELELASPGTNFRRRLTLEGSDDGKDWVAIKIEPGYVVHFDVDHQTVDVRKFRYPTSRYRHLRIRVFPDIGLPNDQPPIGSVTMFRTVQVAGEDVITAAAVGPRLPERGDGGPGSAWLIDFGAKVPCSRLILDIADEEFSRQFHLEVPATEVEANRYLQSGILDRQKNGPAKPLEIRLPHETTARQLRLVVTDNRNPPLTITGVHYAAAARQVVFAPPAEVVTPLRLYFGQPTAGAPHYDFAASLPAKLTPEPLRATLAEVEKNPTYVPPPKPLTERWPALVYIVLTAASLALAGILFVLVREALARRSPPGPEAVAANVSTPEPGAQS
jgi:hypothetical protein